MTALEAMGVTPPIPPRRATIPGLARVRDDTSAADFAIELELRAVGAYSEAVAHLSDPNLLRTIAGAMGTDGQHLVVLRQLAHRNPVPRARRSSSISICSRRTTISRARTWTTSGCRSWRARSNRTA